MSRPEVCIIKTGVANIASMIVAFERLGARVRLVDDSAAVRQAPHVVLPGVGAFAAGMARLAELGMVEAVRERASTGQPLLAVCLGLQLLCASSEESPGVAGLGLVDARVTRFGQGVRVPQFGWNAVTAAADCRMLTDGYAYFANSYRLAADVDDAGPEGWRVATSDHGGRFVAAMERGAWLACQFHPELSGRWGQALLGRWLHQPPTAEPIADATGGP